MQMCMNRCGPNAEKLHARGRDGTTNLAGDGVLRIGRVVRPSERDDTRAHEAANVVDVPARLVVENATMKPDDLFDVQVFL